MLFLAWPGKIGFGRSNLSPLMAAHGSHFGVGRNAPSSSIIDLRARGKLPTAAPKLNFNLQSGCNPESGHRYDGLGWFARQHRLHHRQNFSSDMGWCAASDSIRRRSDDSIFLKRGKTVLSRATIGACNIIARAGVQRTAGCGSFVADSIPRWSALQVPLLQQ
jgi:hypothetical protein